MLVFWSMIKIKVENMALVVSGLHGNGHFVYLYFSFPFFLELKHGIGVSSLYGKSFFVFFFLLELHHYQHKKNIRILITSHNLNHHQITLLRYMKWARKLTHSEPKLM